MPRHPNPQIPTTTGLKTALLSPSSEVSLPESFWGNLLVRRTFRFEVSERALSSGILAFSGTYSVTKSYITFSIRISYSEIAIARAQKIWEIVDVES